MEQAFHSTPGGRLEQAVPESKTLLDLAFAQGESAGAQTAQLMKLLEQYGATALLPAMPPRNAMMSLALRRKFRKLRFQMIADNCRQYRRRRNSYRHHDSPARPPGRTSPMRVGGPKSFRSWEITEYF